MTSNYDIVFFDADETLYDYKRAEKEAFIQTLNKHVLLEPSVLINAHQRYSEINTRLWALYHENKISKSEILSSRFDLLFKELELNLNVEIFGEDYLQKLGNLQFLMPGAKELLQEISTYVHVGIITNGISEVHRKRLENSEIRDFIKSIVVSGDIDDSEFQKPHEKIFHHAHELSGKEVCKDKILMVGDGLHSDIQGGVNYGIHTCWYNYRKEENMSDVEPKHIIYELQELRSIILR